jgi:hypothetical protein
LASIRPVLLGEFPTRGIEAHAEDIVATARTAGYAGAFYWSALSQDECSAYPISSSAFTPVRMPLEEHTHRLRTVGGGEADRDERNLIRPKWPERYAGHSPQ